MATVIRGDDNFDSADYGGFGFNQTWTDFSSSGRVLSTTYTNSTGKSIFISLQTSNANNSKVTIYIDAVKVVANWFQNGGGAQQGATAIIPSGSTYYATMTGSISIWQELR